MATYIADVHAKYDKYLADMEAYHKDRSPTLPPYVTPAFNKWIQSQLAYGAMWPVAADDFYDFDLVYRVSCP